MNSSIYRFSLDLHSAQSQISIPAMLGDTGRTLRISLSDGNKPYIISDGCLATLSVMRPTGTSFIETCTIENNTTIVYSFDQNPNTAAVEGIHECDVVLYGADGREIGSPRFSMVVTTRVLKSDEYIPSDEEKGIFEAMISAEIGRQDAEISRANAEAGRVDAETVRAAAEKARESAFQTAINNSEAATFNAQNVASDLVAKRDNGEFDGKPTEHSWDGSKLTLKSASGETTIDFLENLYDTVYPVGSIYMSTNHTSPALLFGGTWERIKSRFLLGADSDPYYDEYGNAYNTQPTYNEQSEGGEATHKLTVDEMPYHRHGQRIGRKTTQGISWSAPMLSYSNSTKSITGVDTYGNGDSYTASSYREQTSTEYVGDSAAHNNMPPYLAVFVWKRTA